MKVTVDYCEGAYSVYMCFHIPAFRTHPTFIRTGHWVALANCPVIVDYVFVPRTIVLAVVTAERTLGARFVFVSMHMGTLEVLATVGTRNICKFTANKLSTQF